MDGINMATALNLAHPDKRRDLHFITEKQVYLSLDINKKHIVLDHTLSHLAAMMENSLKKKLIYQRWQSKEVERHG